jgi:hypothetical protein
MTRALMLSGLIALTVSAAGSPLPMDQAFKVPAAGEAVAVIHASCERCDWGIEGREAAVVRILVDGKYSQHLALARGPDDADYHVSLGRVSAGDHRLRIEADDALTSPQAGPVAISKVDIVVITPAGDDYVAQSMAPILYARPNTVGRFTDLPVFMWYEIVPAPQGRQLRYSVIFTNEDGGTATDRLMATWGRTTDVEFVYGVTLNGQGKVVAEEFQGPNHEVPAFRGQHEGLHPLEWVSTDNNMVSESGPTVVRYALAPQRFDLTDASREIVMDAHPWIYTLAAKEMLREKKLLDEAPAGSGRIPDPRRFVFVEACTEMQNAAVAFSVHAPDASGAGQWFDADRGLPQFRIVRTGCFRGGVPLPSGAGRPDAIRFKAYPLPARANAPAADSPSAVVLTRVNGVFTIGDNYQPRPSAFSWKGHVLSSRLLFNCGPERPRRGEACPRSWTRTGCPAPSHESPTKFSSGTAGPAIWPSSASGRAGCRWRAASPAACATSIKGGPSRTPRMPRSPLVPSTSRSTATTSCAMRSARSRWSGARRSRSPSTTSGSSSWTTSCTPDGRFVRPSTR